MKTLNEGLTMRIFKFLWLVLMLAAPVAADADASDIPGSADWYLYLDLEQMKSEKAGKALYDWLDAEVLTEVEEEAGVSLDQEVDSLTAFATAGEGPVVVIDGPISSDTKDKIMAVIAAEGDISPLKASGRTYYKIGDGDGVYSNGDVEIDLDSLDDGGWISLDVKNKILITGTEDRMKALLADKGRVPGPGRNKGALLVLTAEKALLQAGMNTGAMKDDGDDDLDSKILRNTEQVAFLLAIVKDKLAIEAELITTDAAMAESLASVARGLISLVAFDDSMDAETMAVLQSTKIEAKGNSLSLSLAVDPDLVVRTIQN
jgi:hypothetical protein